RNYKSLLSKELGSDISNRAWLTRNERTFTDNHLRLDLNWTCANAITKAARIVLDMNGLSCNAMAESYYIAVSRIQRP
ncbi:MAG TPA: hypothetical protein PK819_06865, partial [Thermomicrobiales bacterium]|nr:hypothetical protein [Thermomicrobiales bacterium]